MICQTLTDYEIPLQDFRGQGYDNGSNMKGHHEGAQSRILEKNEHAVFSPCGASTLNLVGINSAQCCVQVITFFGVVQKCYNICSGSTQRWENLKSHMRHRFTPTNLRLAARIDAVKPFAKNLPGLKNVLEEIKQLNLTAETIRGINGISKYITKFECVLVASIWFKILQAINDRNLILPEMNATIDVEVKNLKSLLADLQLLHGQWDAILNSCKIVANGLEDTSSMLSKCRKKQRDNFLNEISDENCIYEE